MPPSWRMAKKSGRRRRIRARGRRRSRPGVAGVVALHTFRQKAATTPSPTARDQSPPSLGFHAGTEAELAFPCALGGVVRRFHLSKSLRSKSCRGTSTESIRSSQNFKKVVDLPRCVGGMRRNPQKRFSSMFFPPRKPDSLFLHPPLRLVPASRRFP